MVVVVVVDEDSVVVDDSVVVVADDEEDDDEAVAGDESKLGASQIRLVSCFERLAIKIRFPFETR